MTITPTPQRRKPTHNLLPLTKSIFMASLLSLSLLSFICFVYLSASSSSAASHHRFHRTPPPPSHLIKPKPRSKPPTPLPKTTTNPPEIILKACKATRFPDICQSSLSNYSQVPQNPTPLQLIQSALSLSAANLKTAQSMAKSILESAAGSINRTNAANNCLEVLANSMYRISSTDDALPRGRTKDARAWTSAALLYQYDCWNALKYANDTSQTDQTMSFLSTLMSFTSNALSMIVSYDLHGDQIASWGPPKTERDGFWRAQSAGSEGNLTTFGGLFPSKLTVDATVCKDGGNNGCYKTVQEAVNAAPDNESGRKFVISIKEGVYEEIVKVPLEKKNVVFLGDGIGKTVITGSLNAGQPGVATYNTATVGTRKHQHLPSYLPSCTKAPEAEIRIACKATLHPESCQSSIIRSNQVPPNPVPLQIMQSALWVSSENLKTARSMLESVLRSSKGNQNITQVAKSCLEVLGNSQYRISQSNDTLPCGQIKNARAWMSAALAYQNDCYGGLKYHAGNILSVNATMSFLDTLIGYTSNALSMIVSYDLFGNATEFWQPPLTERDGFWEGPGLSSAVRLKGHIPSISKADVTVCKDRSTGCYRTVQEAVNAAPDNAVDSRFVIHIKEGVYEEIVRVPFEKKNVAFLGDGMGKTVITGMQSVGQPGVTTYESATVGVLGDGFMASGLTIQNTAGAPTHQAVALRLDSDLSFIENCEFLGNQDTLYAHSLRQYYKSCRIQGNVDFIFGNSAAIFENCTILVKPRQEKPEKGETNAVTAQGRTDPAQSTGFVFQNCLINGTEEYMALYRAKASVHKNFLGRPWKEYSRVVFINCILEGLITPAGWLPWTGDFALKTLYYGEFGNSGPGSDVSQRVSWSNQIPAEHVNTYSVQNFIQGDEWIPTSS